MSQLGLVLLVIGITFVLLLLARLAREASPGARPGGGGGPWEWGRYGSQGGRRAPGSSQRARSPYEVLQVRPGASQRAIAAAYRRLVLQYHPDKVASMAPEFRELAERRMKEINAAYEQLKRS